jgi:hypothetical protein
MPHIDTLPDGSTRLHAGLCTFVHTRLQPGALFTAARGVDDGGLGDSALRWVDDELVRFALPLQWFIDAREAVSASPSVLRTWTRWFEQNAARLRVHVLPGNAVLSMNIDIARHLSGLHGRMVMHKSADELAAALARVALLSGGLPRARFDDPAVALVRTTLPDGSLRIAAPGLHYDFRRLADGTIVTAVEGPETGCLGNAPLDALGALLAESTLPVAWRLDLSRVWHVAPPVAVAWSTWLALREVQFKSIVVLAPAPNIGLFMLGAQYRFKSPTLMRVVRSAEAFAAT